MGKAFQKKTSKCGHEFYATKMFERRSADNYEETTTEKPKKKNKNKKNKDKATDAPATEAPAPETEAPTEAPTEPPTEAPAGPNALCEAFEASMQNIINWTTKYMAACEYTVNKKNKPNTVGKVKDGAKFIKKWKKVVGAFHHGAVNQPNGALCEKESYVPFDN